MITWAKQPKETKGTNLELGVGSAPKTVQHAAPDAFATSASDLKSRYLIAHVLL